MESDNIIVGWTDEELFRLSNRDNHKVVKLPSGDYMWKHNLRGRWVNHCVGTFNDYNKPSHFLHYCISKWIEDLRVRQEERRRKHTAAIRRLSMIKNSVTRTVADKIREISFLGLNFTKEELSTELGVSLNTVKRALKGDFAEVGSSFGYSKPRVVDSSIVYNINDPMEVRIKSKEYLDYVRDFNNKINKNHI